MNDYYNDAQKITQDTTMGVKTGMRFKKVKKYIAQLLIVVATGVAASNCSTTTAPTDSSTNTLDKTSNTTLDATSSTSPGASSGDTASIERYVAVNYGSIQHEMASGEGEHLRALASMLEVPADKHNVFCSMSQQRFSYLFSSTPTSSEQMLNRLQSAMRQEPGLFN